LKQSNKKLERKLQATRLTAVGTYLPKTKGTNFSNALESATTFLYIVLRSQEVFKYHHHQQGVRHHEKFIGISIQVLVSNTERERKKKVSCSYKNFWSSCCIGKRMPFVIHVFILVMSVFVQVVEQQCS